MLTTLWFTKAGEGYNVIYTLKRPLWLLCAVKNGFQWGRTERGQGERVRGYWDNPSER